MCAARLNPMTPGAAPRRPRRFVFHTLAQLRALPVPAYLVDGLVEEGAFALLYARPGGFKTFVALGLAASVATGAPWMGRPVVRGDVVYVAAEGSRGLEKRAAAWEHYHGIAISGMRVVRTPVNFTDPDAVADLVADLRDAGIHPALVVVDTLARCFGGRNENATEDMSRFVAGVDAVRAAFGCCTLVVHHKPYGADKPRGSSALEGAADTMIEGTRSGDVLTLSCTKQKDGDHFDPIRLESVEVDLGGRTSLVLVPAADPSGDGEGDDLAGDAGKEARMAEVLETLRFFGASRAGDWEAFCVRPGLSERTFYRYVKVLVARGAVEKVEVDGEDLYRVADGEPAEVDADDYSRDDGGFDGEDEAG